MTTWASVAGHQPAQPAGVPQETAADQQPSTTAVVDANAIIAGLRLERLAEEIVTIAEVLKEIRDKQSREYLEALPVRIQCLDPSDESLRAGEHLTTSARNVPKNPHSCSQLKTALHWHSHGLRA